MSIANKCYKRKGLQDPNDPTKCLDVNQPSWSQAEDVYGNKWYDFNKDFIKNGVVCDVESDPPTCEILPTKDYVRKGLLDPNNPEECLDIDPHEDYIPHLAVMCYPDADPPYCDRHTKPRDYDRRDIWNDPIVITTCPNGIILNVPDDDVNISDYEFTTESGLFIRSEQQIDLFFEPEENTFGDNLQFTP